MKVLITQRYINGDCVGWSSYNSTGNLDHLRFMLTCPYLIEYIENKGGGHDLCSSHPLIQQFMKELYGMGFTRRFLSAGAKHLTIQEVNGPFTIEENDGLESILERNTFPWLHFEESDNDSKTDSA
jgi:hypothetical protein